MMNKLYIVGDSFSEATANPRTWTNQLAPRLGLELDNRSCRGSSQTHAWQQLESMVNIMTSEDRLIVVMTHPSRVWFFEEHPDICNINIIDLDRHVSREQAQAAELYLRYIQRPSIDCQQVNQRLAWLSWQCYSRGLARPLVVLAFHQTITDATVTGGVDLAKGNLYDIQISELVHGNDVEYHNTLWRGHDSRYNHLTLSNHAILVDKFVDYFQHQQPVNLTQGFIHSVITEEKLYDQDWAAAELDLTTLTQCHQARTHAAVPQAWKQRLGFKYTMGG